MTTSGTAPLASPTNPASRLDWVDYAKGICIIMVVMMHSTLGVEAAAGREGFMHAVVEFGHLPEAASLAAANKRVANILRKQAEEGGEPVSAHDVDPAHFEGDAERSLAAALEAAGKETSEALRRGDYTSVLKRLAQLQAPVDAFFEQVLVNAEDPAVRRNRLALLERLKAAFGAVADIALLRG